MRSTFFRLSATTFSMRAGWMRPSTTNRSIARRAISRRTGSKQEMVTASGVSSTTTSTPAIFSNARMLRPLRPMMRPFISSEGSETVETVTSATCSLATRWIAVVIILRARTSASSLASASTWRITRAISCRVSSSTAPRSSCLASSRLNPATRSSVAICSFRSRSIWLCCLSMALWRLLRACSRCSNRS